MKLSVCMPIYRPKQHLLSAIESVLTQDFDEYELIIVDDCSPTPVDDLLSHFQDARIRICRNSRNLGIPANWNRAIDLANGDYITVFHQDDVMLPGNLRRKVQFLDANPHTAFVHSNIVLIDEEGKTIGGHWAVVPEEDMAMEGRELFAMTSKGVNPVAAPSVMLRSTCLRALGNFDETLPFATDLEMWLRLASKYSVGYLAQPLVQHRLHRHQEGSRFRNSGRDFLDVIRALDKVLNQQLSDEQLDSLRDAYSSVARHSIGLSKWQLRQGNVSGALRYAFATGICLIRVRSRFSVN